MTRAPPDAGFTLVELLVSLALLGVAAVLVTEGFAVDRGAQRRIETRTSGGEAVAVAQDRIRARIEHLFAETRYDSRGPYVALEGASDRLEFLSSTSPSAGAAPDGIMGGDPVMPWRLALAAQGRLTLAREDDPQPEPLLDGVRNLELAYYGAVAPGGAAAWRSEWSRQASPPELVRMRLSFDAHDRRAWPELIVRPAPSVDTACVLDVATDRCRGRE